MSSRIDPNDIVGKKFEKLTVKKYLGPRKTWGKQIHWYLCHCECGNTVSVARKNLVSGNTKSCGCLRGKHKTFSKPRKKQNEGSWIEEEPKEQLPFPDDIVGEAEGRLTCIKRLYQREDRNWVYLVRCECGNEFELDRGNFLLGRTICPKCHNKPEKKPEKKRDYRIDPYDIVGNRYGRLTVMEYVGADDRYNYFYLCKCDCGNEKVIVRRSLIGGHTRSCGCLRKEASRLNGRARKKPTSYIDPTDLVGKRFGKLTVLEYLGAGEEYRHTYLCKCDCGNEAVIPRHSLLCGTKRSCGCLSGSGKSVINPNEKSKEKLQTA